MRPSISFVPYNPLFVYIEYFSLFIIILSSFIIYYKTREIYNLTEHKGIKYFRKGFLFMGFAHIFLLLNILLRPELFLGFDFGRGVGFPLFNLFNFIGIGYLFASIFSKKIKEYYIYVITLSVFFLSFLFQSRLLIGLYSLVLIFGLGIVSIMKFRKGNKRYFSQIYLIYILIFLSWILSMIVKVISDFYLTGRFYVIIFNAIFFMLIVYQVLHKMRT